MLRGQLVAEDVSEDLRYSLVLPLTSTGTFWTLKKSSMKVIHTVLKTVLAACELNMASPEEQNKQVVRQVFEFYNQQDIEKVEKLFSPKHVFHFPGVPPMDWNSHKQFIIGLSKAFPDLHFKIEDILAEGDKVAYRLTVSGTHKGEFQGIRPTDKKVSFSSTGISNIVDGKVAEDWVEADVMGLMQQIAAIPSAS